MKDKNIRRKELVPFTILNWNKKKKKGLEIIENDKRGTVEEVNTRMSDDKTDCIRLSITENDA